MQFVRQKLVGGPAFDGRRRDLITDMGEAEQKAGSHEQRENAQRDQVSSTFRIGLVGLGVCSHGEYEVLF